jgi:hypothetical protein
MLEAVSYSGSLPAGWTWSATNLYNQHAAAVYVPGNSAIMALEVNASARGSSVSTRCILWNVGGSVLRQSATFTMSAAGDGSQSWQGKKTITPYIVNSGTTFWVGLYRRPDGSHTFRVGSGTGYRKTNTSSFPNVSSMSGYNSHADRRPVVKVYYIQKPATPSGIGVSRKNDNKYTITWSRNSTSSNPITNIFVERYNNVTSTWSQVAKLGNVTSYTDSGTISNRSYRWRVRAWNAAGYSSYLTSGTYKTTPANPTNVVAKRSGSNVVITWTRQDTTADNYVVERSANGGAFTQLTASLSGTATSYTDTSPDNLNVYKILARVSTPTTLTSTGTNSNSVQTLSPPAAPTNLFPNSVIDFFEPVKFTWQHNTTDTSEQSKFTLEYDTVETFDNSPVLISEEVSNVEEYEFPGETFDNGETYYWRVRTWGSHGSASSWSSVSSFITISKPEIALTQPENEGIYGLSELVANWDYSDTNGYSQSQYLIKLFDKEMNLLEQQSGISGILSGESDSKTFITRLLNNDNYHLTLQVRNSFDLLSEEVTADFTTNFSKPPKPSLNLTNNNDGTVTLEIINPAPNEEQRDTEYNRVFRKVGIDDWLLVYDNVETDTNIIDYIPKLKGLTYYYIEAVSDVPSSETSYIEEIENNMDGVFYINSGENFEDNIKLYGDIEYSENYDKEQQLIKFVGRKNPVRFEGEHQERIINFSAYLTFEEYDNYLRLIDNKTDCFYRDWRGRYFKCAVSDNNIAKKQNLGYQVSIKITKID